MISLFCRHQWKETERFFYNGRDIKLSTGEISVSAFKEILESCKPKTTILYKCENCGKPKIIVCEGVK